MKKVKNIIIGFGKAGKTLAEDLGKRGESTILIEKDSKMYGGTCINVGCIPSKKLVTLAGNKPKDIDSSTYYKQSILEKNKLIESLNQANYDLLAKYDSIEVLSGEASFDGEHEIKVNLNDGEEVLYYGERIFINTGSTPNIPRIDGIKIDGKRVHTSETLMEDEELPEKLVIIGDGPLGLEFASIYRQFGSEVLVISKKEEENFLNRLDKDVAEEVLKSMKDMGIQFLFKTSTTAVDLTSLDFISLSYETEGQINQMKTDKILLATGRRPNIEQLSVDDAGIYIAENGSIQVNKRLQTNKEHIYALGDVNGGPQQTYLSLDDYRIVRSHLFEDGSYDLADRANIPTTTFIHPPLSTIGLTEEDAIENGMDIQVVTLPVESIPKAKLLSHTVGVYKAIIDTNTEQILGAALFGEESHEVINIIATAMRAEMSYKSLANQVFTHPTMAEALNDLFGNVD